MIQCVFHKIYQDILNIQSTALGYSCFLDRLWECQNVYIVWMSPPPARPLPRWWPNDDWSLSRSPPTRRSCDRHCTAIQTQVWWISVSRNHHGGNLLGKMNVSFNWNQWNHVKLIWVWDSVNCELLMVKLVNHPSFFSDWCRTSARSTNRYTALNKNSSVDWSKQRCPGCLKASGKPNQVGIKINKHRWNRQPASNLAETPFQNRAVYAKYVVASSQTATIVLCA